MHWEDTQRAFKYLPDTRALPDSKPAPSEGFPRVCEMEKKRSGRFVLGRQSSLAPEGDDGVRNHDDGESEVPDELDSTIQLLYLAHNGDVAGIQGLLDSGTDVNSADFDRRTALHVAACEGHEEVICLLLRRGADVNSQDRWGSTQLIYVTLQWGTPAKSSDHSYIFAPFMPLADAIHYKMHDVVKLLVENGAIPPTPPMHVTSAREVPEYEVDPQELDFTNSVKITKGTYRIALWRGIRVAVKRFGEDVFTDEEKVKAFTDELALLQKVRHPNVVQFLGAVTQSSPMMIITEYLPKGDLEAYLKRKGSLKPIKAVSLALDIARGMNYLHGNKPAAIIHCDLKPPNILRDNTGHLKVADFGISKLLKSAAGTVKEGGHSKFRGTSCRYMAPEIFHNEAYDTKVDVFSFALIVQEMIEGCPPLAGQEDSHVAESYALRDARPPFRASAKHYPAGLKELIEQCWHKDPAQRPTFADIIQQLDTIYYLNRKHSWKGKSGKYFRNLRGLWHSLHRKDQDQSSTLPSHAK